MKNKVLMAMGIGIAAAMVPAVTALADDTDIVMEYADQGGVSEEKVGKDLSGDEDTLDKYDIEKTDAWDNSDLDTLTEEKTENNELVAEMTITNTDVYENVNEDVKNAIESDYPDAVSIDSQYVETPDAWLAAQTQAFADNGYGIEPVYDAYGKLIGAKPVITDEQINGKRQELENAGYKVDPSKDSKTGVSDGQNGEKIITGVKDVKVETEEEAQNSKEYTSEKTKFEGEGFTIDDESFDEEKGTITFKGFKNINDLSEDDLQTLLNTAKTGLKEGYEYKKYEISDDGKTLTVFGEKKEETKYDGDVSDKGAVIGTVKIGGNGDKGSFNKDEVDYKKATDEPNSHGENGKLTDAQIKEWNNIAQYILDNKDKTGAKVYNLSDLKKPEIEKFINENGAADSIFVILGKKGPEGENIDLNVSANQTLGVIINPEGKVKLNYGKPNDKSNDFADVYAGIISGHLDLTGVNYKTLGSLSNILKNALTVTNTLTDKNTVGATTDSRTVECFKPDYATRTIELPDGEDFTPMFNVTVIEKIVKSFYADPKPVTPPDEVPPAGGGDLPTPPAGGDDTPTAPAPALVAAPAAPAAPADGPAVLGARRDGGQVLGAKRGVDKAVLGKKRTAATGDSMAVFGWISALMTTLGGAGAAGGALKKSKKEEDAE